MTKPVFDYRESTITYDFDSNQVEFYFTKECDYIRCLKRNDKPVYKRELEPGYIVVYSIEDCRKPELLLKHESNKVKNPYLTTSETT